MSKPYNTCPHCGSNLDHGEHCDCQDKTRPETAGEPAQSAGQLATRNQHEPVLAYGAYVHGTKPANSAGLNGM